MSIKININNIDELINKIKYSNLADRTKDNYINALRYFANKEITYSNTRSTYYIIFCKAIKHLKLDIDIPEPSINASNYIKNILDTPNYDKIVVKLLAKAENRKKLKPYLLAKLLTGARNSTFLNDPIIKRIDKGLYLYSYSIKRNNPTFLLPFRLKSASKSQVYLLRLFIHKTLDTSIQEPIRKALISMAINALGDDFYIFDRLMIGHRDITTKHYIKTREDIVNFLLRINKKLRDYSKAYSLAWELASNGDKDA